MIYTKEYRDNALQLAGSIGVDKASEQLHINRQTLYKWRRKESEKHQSPELPEPKESLNSLPEKPAIDLWRELEEQKSLNRACQQTIEYLVEENTHLRQQCENMLQAISLISQR